jgi:hypothetical protein
MSAAATISTPGTIEASCASPWPMPPGPITAIRILSLAIMMVIPPGYASTTRIVTGSQCLMRPS